MKAKIHPTYYADAKVECACGNNFTTGSTLKEIRVEICSACHPFFTGKSNLIDTTGRVDKFKNRLSLKSKDPVKSRHEKRAQVKAKRISKKVEK